MAKKKEETETTETGTVFIAQEHLREIDKVENKAQLKNLEISIARLRVEKADKELSLLSANYTLKSKERSELSERTKELEKELEELQNNYKSVIKEIALTYSLPERYSYDHITGEVK